MKRFKILVHSCGYEDFTHEVQAADQRKASSTFNINAAIIAWCEHNDIDVDDNFALPFTRVSRA